MEWKEYRLIDVLDALIDYRGKTPKKCSSGVPLITAKIIKNGRIDTPTEFIANEDYESWMVRGFPQVGDVVLTTEAPLGEVAQLYSKDVALAQRVVTLRGKSGVLDNTYLKYYFLSHEGHQRLLSKETGTTVTGIKQSELRELFISCPSYSTQRRIAEILSSLDDKIENNNRINRNLEAQAQALFKSWFVDFEPWGGIMPEDWREGNLLDVAELFDNKRIPLSGMQRDSMEKNYPYYGATSIMDYVDNYLFDGVYLLMGEDGSVMTDDGFPYLQYVEGKFWCNNHAHIMQGKNGYSTEMLYCLLSHTNVSGIVTGAVQGKISQTAMKKISVVIPTVQICKDLADKLDIIFKAIRRGRCESQRLAALRDTLLPKLMKGEIAV